jgi:hypothetical protein
LITELNDRLSNGANIIRRRALHGWMSRAAYWSGGPNSAHRSFKLPG